MQCRLNYAVLAASVSALVALAAPVAMGATVAPLVISSPIQKVYVPVGFDDNDNAEIILHGHYPSPCYKTGPVSAVVDAVAHTIEVTAETYFYNDGSRCPDLVVPFIQDLKLGVVPAGTYKITVKDSPDATAQPLSVTVASTSSPDNFLYAPVDGASLVTSADSAKQALRIEGTYPYTLVGCMLVTDVRTYVTPDNVLVVQPIAQLVTDDSQCTGQRSTHSFTVEKALGFQMPSGDYLIHVRTLNGNSYNRFVDHAGGG